MLSEFGPKKRASLHVVEGEAGLAVHDPGGLEVLDADLAAFRTALLGENHTLKRVLTDPRQFSGIGNAYSDEILHAARLSPIAMTPALTADEVERLYHATRATLADWIERLRAEAGQKFPEKVTAFRPDMAVHGKYQKPCPVCGTPIQRIRYADNETNYCPRCQTAGKILADRSLSRLLGKDFPRTIEELERCLGSDAPIVTPSHMSVRQRPINRSRGVRLTHIGRTNFANANGPCSYVIGNRKTNNYSFRSPSIFRLHQKIRSVIRILFCRNHFFAYKVGSPIRQWTSDWNINCFE